MLTRFETLETGRPNPVDAGARGPGLMWPPDAAERGPVPILQGAECITRTAPGSSCTTDFSADCWCLNRRQVMQTSTDGPSILSLLHTARLP